jgi:hypothetical protein
MLKALDRPHRLAYVLDLLLDLDSQQAGEVLGVSSAMPLRCSARIRPTRCRRRWWARYGQYCSRPGWGRPARVERVVIKPTSPHGSVHRRTHHRLRIRPWNSATKSC